MEQGEKEFQTVIGYEPIHIDDVCRRAGLPVAAVTRALTMMEIKQLVKQVGTLHYMRTREAPASYQAVS